MVELEELYKQVELQTPEVPGGPKPISIYEVQRHWLVYKEAEVERRAEMHLGGSIRPSLYHLASEAVTRARISELREWLDRPASYLRGVY